MATREERITQLKLDLDKKISEINRDFDNGSLNMRVRDQAISDQKYWYEQELQELKSDHWFFKTK